MYRVVHVPRGTVPKQVTSDARSRLLTAAVDHVVEHGLGDLSLRELAAAIGTSHRMLIYHFGSKEELVVAIVQTVEAAELEQLQRMAADPDVPASKGMRLMWKRFTDPSMWQHERLFFEVYGQALQGRSHTTQLLDTIVDSWLEPATEIGVRSGLPRREARANARLGLAVVRGLLLDLLATGDRRGCDAAMERFIALTTA